MSQRPLLMIPGPIEVSEGVVAAASGPPPGHLAADILEAFGSALTDMRTVWKAGADAQPFAIAGSGTIAMEMAVTNLVEPGDRVVVANSGYFSDRVSVMLRRRGAEVCQVPAWPGEAPDPALVADALSEAPTKALFATHVDTSTGVRVDAEALCAAARSADTLAVFDGVCATAGERFEMEA
jgi:alanine-glyoxylate transaminase/serine-glyoxylate transaminase/serine-pyruvate transaminase